VLAVEVVMVPLASLWLPIFLAAVLVFVASSVIHMLLPYHRSDYRKVPSEDQVMEALRRFNIPPGDYLVPCPEGPSGMNNPEFLAKRDKGPVLMATVWPSEPPSMGKSLSLWFVYSLIVGLFAGYVAAITLPAGAAYMTVFRVTATVAFAAYALALWQNTIWYNRDWTITAKSTFDGLIYGLLTGGAFGWLWPGAGA
jgi:hypothetical protein